MRMTKYVIKRIVLMFFTLFVISTICFVLVRILPRELPNEKNLAEVIQAQWAALGYNEPLLTQFVIYLRNIFTSIGIAFSLQQTAIFRIFTFYIFIKNSITLKIIKSICSFTISRH